MKLIGDTLVAISTRSERSSAVYPAQLQLSGSINLVDATVRTTMPGARKRADVTEVDTVSTLVQPLEQLPRLFSASQHSVASHRKHINTLHSLFLRCSQVTTLSSNGKAIKLSGERMFGEAFRTAVVYPLGVKKGVEQGDRVIKFVAGFVAFAVEYGTRLAQYRAVYQVAQLTRLVPGQISSKPKRASKTRMKSKVRLLDLSLNCSRSCFVVFKPRTRLLGFAAFSSLRSWSIVSERSSEWSRHE